MGIRGGHVSGRLAKFHDGVEQSTGKGLNTKIDGSEQAIIHQDEIRIEPDLVLVPLIVGSPAQLGRRLCEDKSFFRGIGSEDGKFLEVMGRTALKTRNCLAAASELVNVCLERDSRSSVIWFMAGHSLKSCGRSRPIQ